MNGRRILSIFISILLIVDICSPNLCIYASTISDKCSEYLNENLELYNKDGFKFQFAIYDIDGDSIPEIILKDDTYYDFDEMSHYTVSKYTNGFYTKLLYIYQGNNDYFKDSASSQFFRINNSNHEIILGDISPSGAMITYHTYQIENDECISKDFLLWHRGETLDNNGNRIPTAHYNDNEISLEDFNNKFDFYNNQFELSFMDLTKTEIEKIELSNIDVPNEEYPYNSNNQDESYYTGERNVNYTEVNYVDHYSNKSEYQDYDELSHLLVHYYDRKNKDTGEILERVENPIVQKHVFKPSDANYHKCNLCDGLFYHSNENSEFCLACGYSFEKSSNIDKLRIERNPEYAIEVILQVAIKARATDFYRNRSIEKKLYNEIIKKADENIELYTKAIENEDFSLEPNVGYLALPFDKNEFVEHRQNALKYIGFKEAYMTTGYYDEWTINSVIDLQILLKKKYKEVNVSGKIDQTTNDYLNQLVKEIYLIEKNYDDFQNSLIKEKTFWDTSKDFFSGVFLGVGYSLRDTAVGAVYLFKEIVFANVSEQIKLFNYFNNKDIEKFLKDEETKRYDFLMKLPGNILSGIVNDFVATTKIYEIAANPNSTIEDFANTTRSTINTATLIYSTASLTKNVTKAISKKIASSADIAIAGEVAFYVDDLGNVMNPAQYGEYLKDPLAYAAANGIRGGRIKLTTNEAQLKHMFRDAEGHFLQDTPANRAVIENAASSSKNFLGVDQFGNNWYAESLPNGTQAWAKVRNGIIAEGGLNQTPHTFNSQTGLSSPIKP